VSLPITQVLDPALVQFLGRRSSVPLNALNSARPDVSVAARRAPGAAAHECAQSRATHHRLATVLSIR
jgi:hypothetical protein